MFLFRKNIKIPAKVISKQTMFNKNWITVSYNTRVSTIATKRNIAIGDIVMLPKSLFESK